MRADEARLPPHSVEAEQSVLGALLLDNEAWDRVGNLVSQPDFYRFEHQCIFGAAAALLNAGKPADVFTVLDQLQGVKRDEDAGGLVYLNALVQSVPSAANIVRYAEIVRQRAMRRQVMRIARDMAEAALNESEATQPVLQLVDGAVAQLLRLQQVGASSEPRDMAANVVAFLDDLQARADGAITTIPTGLHDLDRLTGNGGRRGELWVIGARPSMGKTAFVLQLLRNVGATHQALLLTQEDSVMSSTARMVASAGGVNLADLRNPRNAPKSMWAGVTEGVDQVTTLAVAMDDQTGLGLPDVRRKAQQVRARHRRLDLVVVDYLQLMEGAGDNRSQMLGLIANGLKRLAKELDCWVVLLSQLNREADKRTGPPQMADLRDSGDIEGAADFIGLLHREFMRKPKPENKYEAQMHVCKQKNGPTDTIKLHFDGALQRFGDWAGGDHGTH